MRSLVIWAMVAPACSLIDATGEPTDDAVFRTVEHLRIGNQTLDVVAVTADKRIAAIGRDGKLFMVRRFGPSEQFMIDAPRTIMTGAEDAVAADLDLDGEDEIVIVNGQVVEAISTKTGAQHSCPVGDAQEVVAGDFDRDTTPDVAVLTEQPGQVTVFYGTPGASAQAGLDCASVVTVTLSGGMASTMTVARRTPIAPPEIAVIDGGEVVVLTPNGRSFESNQIFGFGGPSITVSHMDAGDIDGDGRIDLVLAMNPQGSAFVQVGHATEMSWQFEPNEPGLAHGQVAGDLVTFRIAPPHAGAGRDSIALARLPGGPEGVVVVLGTVFHTLVSFEDGWKGQPRSLVAADLDNDGTEDLIGPIIPGGDVGILISGDEISAARR